MQLFRTLPTPVVLTALMVLSLVLPAAASSIEAVLPIPDRYPFRILPGSQAGEYWIVTISGGLLLLSEDTPGSWTNSEYFVSYVNDAVFLNVSELLYCVGDDPQTGNSIVVVFDCDSQTVVDTFGIGTDYRLASVCVSDDESSVFVLGWDWPRDGEGYSFIDSGAHRDSGIVWKIDTSTMTVVGQGITAALPETIFYAESESERDKLLISTQEVAGWGRSWASILDFVNTGPGLPRDGQMLTPHNTQQYRHDFVDWSDSEPLVAMCCTVDPQMQDPDYMAGLWIIDTDLAQVVQTLTITYDGRTYGVKHACVSRIDPCHVYITPDVATTDQLFVIDHDSGAVIDTIPLPPDFTAEFIYEIPDGRLIVTGGESEKILIIDPTS